ncbi:MAG: protein O-mannosyl-transferase family, partial [Chthoniobacterales bacterium]
MAKNKPSKEPDPGTGSSPLFARPDWVSAAVTAVISGAVYFYTAMPNVGLLDSGEFVVAAQHFGVPHPTGYPLWTLLTWLFQLLPIGNAAWEVNLFSGLCG